MSLLYNLPLKERAVVVLDELLEKSPEIYEGLPCRPTEPTPRDCCGQSCTPCVFDLYKNDTQTWALQCLNQLDIPGFEIVKGHNLDAVPCIYYRKYRITCINKLACNDTNIYTFESCHVAEEATRFLPGTHLVLKGLKDDGSCFTREYTPLPSSNSASLKVLIRLYEDGLMSNYLTKLAQENVCEWRGPIQKLNYRRNQYSHILLLAAGTGIAPMLQIISHVLQDELEETRLSLVYSCSTYSRIYMKQYLRDCSTYWNFNASYYLSEENNVASNYPVECSGTNLFWKTRLSEDLLCGEIKKTKCVGEPQAMICGPLSYVKDMVNHLKHLSFSDDKIFRF